MIDDPCPTFPPCPGCGARLCAECGDDYRETDSGYMCGDCVDEEAGEVNPHQIQTGPSRVDAELLAEYWRCIGPKS